MFDSSSMAGEEGTHQADLDWLLAQQQRPTVARMVSREVNTERLTLQETDTSYQGKASAGDSEMTNPLSAHDCYGTEDDCSNLSYSTSDESTCSSDDCDDEGYSLDDKDDFMDCLAAMTEDSNKPTARQDNSEITDHGAVGMSPPEISTSGAPLHPGHRRKPSRRQRKRSQAYREMVADNIAMLRKITDMGDYIDDTCQQMSETNMRNDQLYIPVPSLTELCMSVIQRACKKDKYKQLPVTLQNSLSGWRHDYLFLRKQLSWLLNHVLVIWEKDDNLEQYSFYFNESKSTFNSKDNNNHCVYSYPTRSVWNSFARSPELRPPDTPGPDVTPYTSGKAASFLLAVDVRSGIYEETFSFDYLRFLNVTAMTAVVALSVLATTIDLMLPATVPVRTHTRVGKLDTSQVYSQLMANVKYALHCRFPRVVAELYDRAMPYVMWARGNVRLATHMFRNLIDMEKRSRHKAMYLSEIARMNSMFGDITAALAFYRLASEAALVKNKYGDVDIAEVTEQQQILLARVHDTGLLTEKKGQDSCQCWTSAVNLPQSHLATCVAAVDAFLCFHAYRWTDGSWTDEALARIQPCLHEHPYLHYYSALLFAVQGRQSESDKEYQQYKRSVTDTPEYALMSDYCSWQPLVAIVTSQSDPVKPINMVWRTQLVSPFLTNKRPLEADMTCIPPNLRLDEDGHVTGDMQMLLPPIREICLNPYTGSIKLTHVPSFTSEWRTSCLDQMCYNELNPSYTSFNYTSLLIPMQHHIYSSDDSDTRVYLEKAGSRPWRPDCQVYPSRLVLHWSSGGQRADMNLLKAINRKMRQVAEDEIRSDEKYSEDMKVEMLEMIPVCLCKNKAIIKAHLETAYNNKHAHVKRSRHDRRKNREDELAQLSTPRQRPQFWYIDLSCQKFEVEQIHEAIVLKNAVVLRFLCHPMGFTLFFRTDSKEDFLDYCILQREEMFRINKHILPLYQLDQYDAEFFMMQSRTSCKDLDIHNVAGEVVQTLSKMVSDGVVSECCPCIVGSDVLAITRNRHSVWIHRIGDDDDGVKYRNRSECRELVSYFQHSPGNKVKDLKVVGRNIQDMGKLLLVYTTLGVCFLNPATMTLVPIAIATKNDAVCQIGDNGKIMRGRFSTVKVLSEKFFSDCECHTSRVAIAMDFNLLVFDIVVTRDNSITLTLISSHALAGLPMEACFVGKLDILVTATQHEWSHSLYRDHLFHFTLDGPLKGILLCLGRGPRSFLPVYLHGNPDVGGRAGWYVYMRDGHGGIIGVRLDK